MLRGNSGCRGSRFSSLNRAGALAWLVGLFACVAVEASLAGRAGNTFALESEYVFRGRAVSSASLQPGIDWSHQGWFAGVASNQPVNDNGEGGEFNLHAGRGTNLSGSLYLDAWLTFFHFPESAVGREDALEFATAIYWEAFLAPSLYLYANSEGAFTAEFSAGYERFLSGAWENTSLRWTLVGGAMTGGDDYWEERLYLHTRIDLTYTLTERLDASVGYRLSWSDLSDGVGGGWRQWAGIAVHLDG